jgi:hypothetical protein
MVPYDPYNTTSKYYGDQTGWQMGWTGGYRTCHCTFTVCRCYTGWNLNHYVVIDNERPSRAMSAKRRRELLPLPRSGPEPKVKTRGAQGRPSIQALSVRIR